MKSFDYIKKRTLKDFNWSLLFQFMEEDGIDFTEEGYKYLRETPENTNLAILELYLIER